MKKIFLIAAFALTSAFVYAQDDTSDSKEEETETTKDDDGEGFQFKKENFFLGGGIGGGISNNQTFISVSPLLGYKFTDRLSAGPRLIYNYYSDGKNSSSNYGAGFMGRFFASEALFLQSEYQGIWHDDQFINENPDGNRVLIPSLFAGVGYYSSPILFSVMYDFLWKNQTSRHKAPQAFSFNLGFMF